MNLLEEVSRKQMRSEIPKFNVGDTVRVHFRIVEGDKERIQVFEGVVIGRNGAESPNATFTVRRVAFNEGVERVFPLHSPRVADVQVTREGRVRRAKLYYLRDRIGKSARVKERLRASSKSKAKAERRAAATAAKAAAKAAEAPAETPSE